MDKIKIKKTMNGEGFHSAFVAPENISEGDTVTAEGDNSIAILTTNFPAAHNVNNK